MDLIHLAQALLLGIVEGLTEFLPISSTGHLILVGDWIGFESTDGKVFEVVIQLGAILAVCWLYRARVMRLLLGLAQGQPSERRFALTLILAFLPAAVVGALAIDFIKAHLFQPLVVATTLILGGLVLLWVERRTTRPVTTAVDALSLRQALIVGLAQCFALIPGTSRSGATIVGGLLAGLSRPAAAEFSFFLAMPTMLGAAVYDGWRHHHLLAREDLAAIAIGFVAAFVSALLVVKALVRFVAHHSFRPFAWYRIVLGLLVLAWFAPEALRGGTA